MHSNFNISKERKYAVYDICRLQTADCRLQTADCRLQTADCYLRDTNCKIIHIENIRIKVTSSSIKQRQKKNWKSALAWGSGYQVDFSRVKLQQPVFFLFLLNRLSLYDNNKQPSNTCLLSNSSAKKVRNAVGYCTRTLSNPARCLYGVREANIET